MFSREDLIHLWVHRELVLSAAVYVGEFIGLDSVFRLRGDLIQLSSSCPNCTVMAKTQKGRLKCDELFP